MKVYNEEGIVTLVLKEKHPEKYNEMLAAAKVPKAKVYAAQTVGWNLINNPSWLRDYAYKVEVPEKKTRHLRYDEYFGEPLRFKGKYDEGKGTVFIPKEWNKYDVSFLGLRRTWKACQDLCERYLDGQWVPMEVEEDDV